MLNLTKILLSNLRLRWQKANQYPHFLLITICIVGLILRTIYFFQVDSILYPDEVFQYLEQGFRLSHGYGIIPWEYVYGVRTWIIPICVAGIFKILQFMGINSPHLYIPIIKFIFAILSLSLIVSIYYIVLKLTEKKYLALLSAYGISIWYSLIVFSSKALSEFISTYLVFAGLALLLSKKIKWICISGILLGLGALVRFQYAFIPILILMFFAIYSKSAKDINVKFAIITFLITVLMGGILDKITWGQFFFSTRQFLYLNHNAYITTGFGVSSWNYYLLALLNSFWFLFIFTFIKNKKLLILQLLVLITIFIYSLAGHKEYRYLYIVIPAILAITIANMLGIALLFKLSVQKSVIIIGLLVSLLSAILQLSNTKQNFLAYPNTDFNSRPKIELYKYIAKIPHICGLWDQSSSVWEGGGYYYLGKNIQIYDNNEQAKSLDYVNLIITKSKINVPGFTLKYVFEEYNLLIKEGGCRIDADYSYIRFPTNFDLIIKYMPSNKPKLNYWQ